MKLQIHENGAVNFYCDACGKLLDEADPGEVFFRDYDWFVDHVEKATADDVWFLCRKCFSEHRGEEQPWYDKNWRELAEGE